MISATTPEDNLRFCAAISYSPTKDFKGVKLERAGQLIILAGYDYWTPNAVQMHIWIPNPSGFSSREFIREAFRYPFEDGQRKIVVGVTPGDNALALEFNRRIGFHVKHRIIDGWADGVDMVIQELRRDECRWLFKRAA